MKDITGPEAGRLSRDATDILEQAEPEPMKPQEFSRTKQQRQAAAKKKARRQTAKKSKTRNRKKR